MREILICNKCQREVISGQGLTITMIDTGDENTFCRSCITEALATLNMRKNKKPDEIALMIDMRKFLKHKTN